MSSWYTKPVPVQPNSNPETAVAPIRRKSKAETEDMKIQARIRRADANRKYIEKKRQELGEEGYKAMLAEKRHQYRQRKKNPEQKSDAISWVLKRSPSTSSISISFYIQANIYFKLTISSLIVR